MKPSVEATQQHLTPEARCQVLAQRNLKNSLKRLKKPNFNIPDKVPLLPSREFTVGRCTADVIMHSPKLPSMLSRKHAAIKYNPKNKQWLVEDLEVSSYPKDLPHVKKIPRIPDHISCAKLEHL